MALSERYTHRAEGLTTAQAAVRLAADGPNVLPRRPPPGCGSEY
ncbi:cation-transporting P-type ATPase [Nocardia sp. NPDC019395]